MSKTSKRGKYKQQMEKLFYIILKILIDEIIQTILEGINF